MSEGASLRPLEFPLSRSSHCTCAAWWVAGVLCAREQSADRERPPNTRALRAPLAVQCGAPGVGGVHVGCLSVSLW